jgi:hypothetical protein
MLASSPKYVVDDVHRHTTHVWVRLALRKHRMVPIAGFEERLINNSTTRDCAYGCTTIGIKIPDLSRWQLDHGLADIMRY